MVGLSIYVHLHAQEQAEGHSIVVELAEGESCVLRLYVNIQMHEADTAAGKAARKIGCNVNAKARAAWGEQCGRLQRKGARAREGRGAAWCCAAPEAEMSESNSNIMMESAHVWGPLRPVQRR